MLSTTRFSCEFGCETALSMTASNLKKHLKSVHNFSQEDIEHFKTRLKASKAKITGKGLYKCEECQHISTSKKASDWHMKNKHKRIIVPEEISLFADNDITPIKKPSKINESSFEEVKTDGDWNEIRRTGGSYQLKCEELNCEWIGKNRKEFAQHMMTHNNLIEIESEEFQSVCEYEAWLRVREEDTLTSLVVRNSYTTGSLIYTYCICHREGKYNSVSKTRKGHCSRKVTGERRCTCFLESVRNLETGILYVTSCFYHINHNSEVALQILRQSHKDEVASLLKLTMTTKQIIFNLMRKFGPTHRLGYISTDDVRQIQKSENLAPGRFCENDLESIEMRFIERGDSDGLRLFEKPKNDLGEGFRLVILTDVQLEMLVKYSHRGIIMDDTFSITRNSLKLTTVVVLNGNDKGIPIAFMLSYSATSDDISILFQTIRELYPEFNPESVMTDEANSFYNGFKKAFSNATPKKYWCRWHVLRAWGKKCSEYLNTTLANDITKRLKTMIREPNLSELNIRINEVLHILESDSSSGSSKMADYLRRYYLPKITEWSAVYRQGIPFNTTMHCENWHSVLKGEILQKKGNMRIDEFVQKLLDGIDWLLMRNARDVARKLVKAAPRVAETRKKCYLARQQVSQYLIQECAEGFAVTKLRDGREYTIRDNLSCHCDRNENVHCPECDACPYRLFCDCLSQLAGISCKHAHMASKFSLETENPPYECEEPSLQLQSTNENSQEEIVALEIEEVDQELATRDRRNEIYHRLTETFNVISSNLRTLINQNDENSDRLLKDTLEDFTRAKERFSANESTICVRKDYRTRSTPIRKVMNNHGMKLKTRFNKRKNIAEHLPEKRIDLEVIEICNICKLPDPSLPSDIESDEEEARITLWKVCNKCGVFVHFSCSLSNKICYCGGKYVATSEISDNESEDSIR